MTFNDANLFKSESIRANEISLNELLDDGLYHYLHGEWSLANAKFFTYILKQQECFDQKIEALYFYSKSLFNDGNYHMASEAQLNLLLHLDQFDARYDDILWDSGMVALQIDRAKANRIMYRISIDSNSSNQGNAIQMIDLLKE